MPLRTSGEKKLIKAHKGSPIMALRDGQLVTSEQEKRCLVEQPKIKHS